MLLIRITTFECASSADKTFSMLDWKVEKVKRLTNRLLNYSTADTTKPWVGKLERDKREFRIIQTSPFLTPRILTGNFFPLYVHGQIFENRIGSEIILRFKLGLMTALLFVLVFLLPFTTMVTYLSTGTKDNFAGLLLSGLVPLTIMTLLLIVQLHRTENRLMDLFRLDVNNFKTTP